MFRRFLSTVFALAALLLSASTSSATAAPSLVEVALRALVGMSPPAAPRRPLPGWEEAPEGRAARYQAIAEDIGAVAGSRIEVADLVGVAVHESGLAPDVDAGQCYRGPGWEKHCDSGRAVSIWQLHDRDPERFELLRTSRREAARVALGRIRGSRVRCAANPPAERLSEYASGNCDAGREVARELEAYISKARRFVSR